MTSASSMTKPWVVGGGEAGAYADGAVDVGDGAARAADEVVVVVADAHLVARDRARGLDPSDEPGVGERAEHVVDRLVRDGRLLGAHRGEDGVGVGVRLAAYGPQHGEARPGDPQVSARSRCSKSWSSITDHPAPFS